MPARQKATYYLSADVRTATKVAAAAGQRSESDVVEEALRRYLTSEEAAQARAGILELMDRISERFDLPEEAAEKLANDELHAMRSERRRRQ